MRSRIILIVVLLAAIIAAAYFITAKKEVAVATAPTDEYGHAENSDEYATEGKKSETHEAEGQAHGEHEEEGGDKTEISEESANTMEIEILTAGPSAVHQTISLTGKITLNQNKTAQISARFPGIVRDVKKSIGSKVAAGETLALVESNDSLQVYAVKAPFAGTVLARDTNIGDVAEGKPIFTVADLNQLWGEFFVFSRDLDRIKPDQKIDIISLNSDSLSTEATIASLLPTAESSSQTVVARVLIDNSDNKWRAGMTVRGDVVLSEREVPLAVKSAAIQRQEGANVVYVKKGQSYEMRKVELGEADREWTEILGGIEAGEEYVATNSFVVKADIGKAAAEHAH